MLLENGIHFPYTHDIAKLITLINEAEIPWPEAFNQAADLTEYATETRYPGGVEPVSEEDYRKAIEIAEQVLAWAISFINKTT